MIKCFSVKKKYHSKVVHFYLPLKVLLYLKIKNNNQKPVIIMYKVLNIHGPKKFTGNLLLHI